MKKYALEIVIVAFGVFLGVFAGEWNTKRNIEANNEKTLVFILDEIESNIEKFDRAVKYHKQLNHEVDSLWSTLETRDKLEKQFESNKFRYSNLPSWNTIGTANPDNIVFESAKISGVFQEIDIKTTKLIANAYKYIQLYQDISKATLEKMLATNSDTKIIDVYKIFYLLKYDVFAIEQSTLSILKKTRKDLEEILGNK
jgi:hypothetical protein